MPSVGYLPGGCQPPPTPRRYAMKGPTLRLVVEMLGLGLLAPTQRMS
jgi:hypothetical protein